jgi:hypothetical protein
MGSIVNPTALHSSARRVAAIELHPGDERYPDLVRVLAYWNEKRQSRFAPRRADLDPADLIDVLPRVMLADVLRDPLDFHYRLSGTGILNVHGQEMTERRPRDLAPVEFGNLIYDHYCEAVHRCVPLLHLILLDTFDRSRSYVRLLMPLSEDGAAVTMLFAVDSKEQNTSALRKFFAEATHGS